MAEEQVQGIVPGGIMLKVRELFISDYTKDGITSEVVNIKGSIAFDEGFIAECRQAGVKKVLPREDREEIE